MKIKGQCAVVKWNEDLTSEISEDTRITKAAVEYAITGDLEGKLSVQYLMYYSKFDKSNPHGSTATYVGVVRFEGKITGKSGSFVLTENGTFEGGIVNSKLSIVKDSGTDKLKIIDGSGVSYVDNNSFVFELDCTI